MTLERRTPIRRDGPGARRFAAQRSTLKRGRPLPKVSTKRKAENRERRARLLERFGPNPPCHIGPLLARAVADMAADRLDVEPHERRALERWTCTGWARDGHEVLTRGRGGSITDPDNVLPGCGSCHRLVTDYKRLADAIGATRPSWS